MPRRIHLESDLNDDELQKRSRAAPDPLERTMCKCGHALVPALQTVFADNQHYVLAEAAQGQAALDILCAGTASTVVLFDLSMPVMDGQQLLQHILADAALAARCALVCMTASDVRRFPDVAALLEAYGIPVLAKPFDIDDLLAVVATAADTLPA